MFLTHKKTFDSHSNVSSPLLPAPSSPPLLPLLLLFFFLFFSCYCSCFVFLNFLVFKRFFGRPKAASRSVATSTKVFELVKSILRSSRSQLNTITQNPSRPESHEKRSNTIKTVFFHKPGPIGAPSPATKNCSPEADHSHGCKSMFFISCSFEHGRAESVRDTLTF